MNKAHSVKSVSSAILIAVAAVVASVPVTRATVVDRSTFSSNLPTIDAKEGVELIRKRRSARKARRHARKHRRKARRSRRYHRRYARRGHRRRHRRYRRGIYVSPYIYSIPYGYYYPYRSRRYYGLPRCTKWHRRCVRNWGYGNRNYRGCMRYHGCRPR